MSKMTNESKKHVARKNWRPRLKKTIRTKRGNGDTEYSTGQQKTDKGYGKSKHHTTVNVYQKDKSCEQQYS